MFDAYLHCSYDLNGMSAKKKTRAAELKTPKFASEAEEARWWADHQDEIAGVFKSAAAEGRLRRGTVARKGATPTTTIRLDPDDISRARQQAERKGLRYQTYLKMLLREALLKEERKAG
jgi:predicted DNA binding CopG/RHH family protein